MILNPKKWLLKFCAHCFPRDTLLSELDSVILEQQRKVLNYEDDLIRARFDVIKERARLRAFIKNRTALQK